MKDLGNILHQAIHSIEETAECIYQNKIEEAYRKLDVALIKLDDAMREIALFRQNGNVIDLDENKVVEHLTEAMKALEQKDLLLLADILLYEIKELLVQGYSSL